MDEKVEAVHTLLAKYLDDVVFRQAFTHSSRKGINFNVVTNERMELVGDKVIDLLLYDWIYKNADYYKGRMDDLRKQFHTNPSLSETFDLFEFDRYVTRNPGTQLNETIKANVMESLFYAAYLKGGLKLTNKFWRLLILSQIKERYPELSEEESI